MLHDGSNLGNVEDEDHSLLHGHVEPVEVLVHHHSLGFHVGALDLLDPFALSETADDDPLVLTQRVDELFPLVDEKTLDFRVALMCINHRLSLKL